MRLYFSFSQQVTACNSSSPFRPGGRDPKFGAGRFSINIIKLLIQSGARSLRRTPEFARLFRPVSVAAGGGGWPVLLLLVAVGAAAGAAGAAAAQDGGERECPGDFSGYRLREHGSDGGCSTK